MSAIERRREAAEAGHQSDEPTARRLLSDADAAVRATAYQALDRMGSLSESDLAAALADPDGGVRRRGCQLATTRTGVDLVPLLADDDHSVAEVAAWALGEQGAESAIDALCSMATEHTDPLCREAAVAALGAIGHPGGLSAILAGTQDKAPIRRRAVLALAPFEGPEVDAALQAALSDRDWQVRQAAEDLLSD